MNPDEALTQEATRLIVEADAAGLVLRALGSVAVRLHCEPSLKDMDSRARVPKDIDLITRKRDRSKITGFFEERGYVTDREMLVSMEGTRYLFSNPDSGIDVDLWVDELDLCHRLDVKRRLGSGPTLSIEDLLLSKLQIVELTEGDINDLGCILSTHELGQDPEDPEVIDTDYIVSLLSSDWGFWKTATKNLHQLSEDPPQGVQRELDVLIKLLERAPKSAGWKIRSLVGERMQWWQDVDLPRDTY